MRRLLVASIVLLALAFLPATARPLPLTWETFEYPNATRTWAYDINDHGQIVGFYTDAGGRRHAFVRQPNGSFESFNVTETENGATVVRDTEALAINNSGVIVGMYSAVVGPIDIGGCAMPPATEPPLCPRVTFWRGFVRTPDGNITPFDNPVGDSIVPALTIPRSINDAGDIVGYYEQFDHWQILGNRYVAIYGADHGFIKDKTGGFTTVDYSGAVHTNLNGINNRGEVTGYIGYALDYRGASEAFVYLRGAFTEVFTYSLGSPPESCGGSGSHMNDLGELVGICFEFTSSPATQHSLFRDTKGNITNIDVPGAVNTIVESINNRGVAVGMYTYPQPTGGTKTYAFTVLTR